MNHHRPDPPGEPRTAAEEAEYDARIAALKQRTATRGVATEAAQHDIAMAVGEASIKHNLTYAETMSILLAIQRGWTNTAMFTERLRE